MKDEALLNPHFTLEHKAPKPPAARRMKLSSQATEREPMASVPRTVGKNQMKGEALSNPQFTLEHREKHGELPKPSAARRMKLSTQATEVRPLARVQGTMGQSQTKNEALLSPQFTLERNLQGPPTMARGMRLSPQTTEGGSMASFQATVARSQTNSEALMSPQFTLDHNNPRPPTERQTKVSPMVTEALPSLQLWKKETPPSLQPKSGSYAYLNLKRREFEALQQLQSIARRSRERNSQELLTVKPALPGIKPTQEPAVKPHPPAPTAKKALPSARPTVKRQRPKLRATLDRQLPSLQPTVTQALPSLNSSNTLVKQPLPSVQPEENFTEQSDFQPVVKKIERNSQCGHMPGVERQ